MTPVIVRGYLGLKLIFEEPADGEILDPEDHTDRIIAGEIDMVELEFVGYPLNERFLRIGTNLERMVTPVKIILERYDEERD